MPIDTAPDPQTLIEAAVVQAAGLPHSFAPSAVPSHSPDPSDLAPPAPPPKGPAQSAYERLILYIRNFEAQLDPAEEMAMGYAGSDAGVLRIEGLGFHDPDLVTFYGRDEAGARTQLIQHVSQLNVLLRAVPKASPEEPARRIGFRLQTGWQGGDAGDASAAA